MGAIKIQYPYKVLMISSNDDAISVMSQTSPSSHHVPLTQICLLLTTLKITIEAMLWESKRRRTKIYFHLMGRGGQIAFILIGNITNCLRDGVYHTYLGTLLYIAYWVRTYARVVLSPGIFNAVSKVVKIIRMTQFDVLFLIDQMDNQFIL